MMKFHLMTMMAALGAIAIAVSAQSTQPASAPASAASSQPTSQPVSQPATQPTTQPGFAGQIEAAHGMADWLAQEAVEFDVEIIFGGETSFEGHVLFDHHTSRVRITLPDETVLVFDGEEAHVSPAEAEVGMPRFQLLTWTYFLAVPFKLRDPGSRLGDEALRPLGGDSVPSARLTFDSGVGDAPEDWYIAYRDPETNRLAALAYIVTYFRGGATGEEDVHSVTYDSFAEVDGAVIPTAMTFLHWTEDEGPGGEPVGSASFSNPRFVEPDSGAFEAPADSRVAPLPGS